MRFFNFFRWKENRVFIADNVLAFYMILRDNFGDSFTREQIIFATGLMDVYVYLEKGLITPVDIARAVGLAKLGECAVHGKKIAHARTRDDEDMSGYDPDEEELLVNFIMQIECIIMAVKRKRRIAILKAVLSRKDIIRECARKGLQEGERHKFYAPLSEQAKNWFTMESMNKIVTAFTA